MAEAKLNFDESALEQDSALYKLYDKLYKGMVAANEVDAPDFSTDPPLTEDGSVDMDAINKEISDYSTILMKNSAYLYASSILDTIGGDGGGGGGDNPGGDLFVSRSGDSMEGRLTALYGFQAGYDGRIILETAYDGAGQPIVYVNGQLDVDQATTFHDKVQLADSGLWFGENQVLWYDGDRVKISNAYIDISGAITLDGSLSVGDVHIDEHGITWGDYEFYHSGNCNNKDTDWTMKDSNVYGDLHVQGNAEFNGPLISNAGFTFNLDDRAILYTAERESQGEGEETVKDPYIVLQSDFQILGNHGIQFGDSYIIRTRQGTDGVVSFSAPDMIMNLGDSDNGKATRYISLQTGIRNYDSTYQIVSQYGDGNFPNSFSAGSGNSGSPDIRTYYATADDQGVVFPHRIRFYDEGGAMLYASDDLSIAGAIPYSRVSDGGNVKTPIAFKLDYQQTTSLFRDLSKEWSATLHVDTDAEFISLDKPVESVGFSIKSEQYYTRLIENALYFNEGVFLEGVTDGIRHAGNAYFDGNLSSERFASGLAGYGFGIIIDKATGDYNGTLDNLTVRKKFRAYEFEVQKISATNGSLWVSDSCSGDEVKELD